MLAIIFIVTLYMNALNIKAVLTVTRSITDPQLFYVNDFHTVLIPVDLCLKLYLTFLTSFIRMNIFDTHIYIYIYNILTTLQSHI